MGRRGWRTPAMAAAVALLCSGCALLRPDRRPGVGDVQQGLASWYGPGFHGRRTASGERFDQHALTAAHRNLPFGTHARVTSLTNDRSVEVRINDRGPFVRGRIVDLSRGAAERLRMIGPGVMPVRLEVVTGPGRPRLLAGPAAPAPVPAWIVRLGPFARREEAESVRRAVARRFPDARVRSAARDRKETWRVQLGPYQARRSAEARAQIAGRLGYQPVVLAESAD